MRLIPLLDYLRVFPLGYGCLFYSLSGIPCPLCGMTRSILSILSLEMLDGFQFHLAGPFVFFSIIITGFLYLFKNSTYETLLAHWRKYIAWYILSIWIVRIASAM